jgi:SAM-dependent methyltransferase
MITPCILCGNTTNNKLYTIKELQLGLDEYFEYQLCGACGTMQLQNIPDDLGKYYPNEDYYSFNLELDIREKPDTLRKIKTDYLLFGKQTILGALLSIGYKMNEFYEWMKFSGAKYDDKILDVGTGNGSLLARLFKMGFTNLTGIDPFINQSKDYGAIKVLKKDIFEMDETYDIIMMHHALEHTLDPKKIMAKIFELLDPGGKALIRVPIMGNYGWQRFQEFWSGIDAPRHIFIPSEQGLKKLVTEAGFIIDKFYYDSSDYMIISSEQYKKGIPLHAPNSYTINEEASMFTKTDARAFRKIMYAQNKLNNGDMAAIYVSKPA